MKKYQVNLLVTLTGWAGYEVEAENEEEAIKQAKEEFSRWDVEVDDWQIEDAEVVE